MSVRESPDSEACKGTVRAILWFNRSERRLLASDAECVYRVMEYMKTARVYNEQSALKGTY